MPRPVWEGHLRLSLVTCPVALFKATNEGEGVHFHLLHPVSKNRVRQAWKDPALPDGEQEVARSALLHGFEIERGSYVVIDDEDLAKVRLESTKTIQIERFVDAKTIDRIYWDQPYYMAPTGKKDLQEPFAVIRDAMEKAGRIAIGRVVMAGRERVVGIEPRHGGLLLSTLHTSNEVRADSEVFDGLGDLKGESDMVDIAEAIIAKQAGAFDPAGFHDRYAEALRALVEEKAGTATVQPEAEAPESNVVDLMEALRRSLKGPGGPADAPPSAGKVPSGRKKPAAPPKGADAPVKKPSRRRAG